MSVEYWLIDSESGNAQGCYLSLNDALRAAEIESQGQRIVLDIVDTIPFPV